MARCPDGHESSSDDYCDVCGMLMAGSAPSPAASAGAGTGGASGASGGAAAPGAAGGASGAASSASSLPDAAGAAPCPDCGAPRSGQFCESCGFNFATGQALPPTVASPTIVAPSASVAPPTVAPSTVVAPSAPVAPPTVAPPTVVAPSAPAPERAPTPSVSSAPAFPPASSAPSAASWSVVVSADRDYYDSILAASGSDSADLPFPPYCPDRRFQLTGTEVQVGRRSPSRGLDPEIDLTGPPLDPGVSRLHVVLIAMQDGSWAALDPGSANGTQVNGADIPTGVQVPLHDGDRIGLGAWTVITVHAG